jgi:hypothetical protein
MPLTYGQLAETPALWASLPPEPRQALAIHLRDQFFALSSRGTDPQRALFREAIASIDPEPTTRLQGLSVSFFPTARFYAVRYVDAQHLLPALRPLFSRPSPGLPELAAVFVDPQELSFRTFENIVPLDRWLSRHPLDISLRDLTPLGEPALAWALSMVPSEQTREALLGLDDLDLYAPPLDASSRGGLRLIFHCASLGEALTAAFREVLPEEMLVGFSHVNPVFRCNRFEPSDEPFHSHVDSPYSDASRHHVSRYTLLLYLTGGALRIADLSLQSLPPFTAVLFHQSHEHEGLPFPSGRKVFLRTELVYEEPEVTHQPAIAELFAKACYMTGESLYTPELAPHTHALFNRAAKAHWMGAQTSPRTEPFVHKQFRGVHFLANGYDSWFPQGPVSLVECAALTLLDFFNVSLGEVPFHKLCTSEVVQAGRCDPPRLLAPHRHPLPEPLFIRPPRELLLPPSEPSDPDQCCPECNGRAFVPSRSPRVIRHQDQANAPAHEALSTAPLFLMGQEVFLDPEKFLVRGNQIFVLSREALQPLHFAAHHCWYEARPEDYLQIEASLRAWQLLVPPILFAETDGCWHLMFDFFRNGWAVKETLEDVSVYRIRAGEARRPPSGAP